MHQEKVKKNFGRNSNNQCYCEYCFILHSCTCRNRGWISCMAMAAQEQEVGSRISRRSYFISIWDNPNTATCKLWKSICCIWRCLYSLVYYLGYDSGQKETRQTRGNRFNNRYCWCISNILWTALISGL